MDLCNLVFIGQDSLQLGQNGPFKNKVDVLQLVGFCMTNNLLRMSLVNDGNRESSKLMLLISLCSRLMSSRAWKERGLLCILNVISLLCSRLILLREDILASSSPVTIFRTLCAGLGE